MLDVVKILDAVSKYTGHYLTAKGHGLKINGTALYPSVSMEDAVMLAADMGIGIRFYTAYNSVSAVHSIVLNEVVETWAKTSIKEATIRAILTVAYRVATSGRR
jgi:hypothetical protein